MLPARDSSQIAGLTPQKGNTKSNEDGLSYCGALNRVNRRLEKLTVNDEYKNMLSPFPFAEISDMLVRSVLKNLTATLTHQKLRHFPADRAHPLDLFFIIYQTWKLYCSTSPADFFWHCAFLRFKVSAPELQAFGRWKPWGQLIYVLLLLASIRYSLVFQMFGCVTILFQTQLLQKELSNSSVAEYIFFDLGSLPYRSRRKASWRFLRTLCRNSLVCQAASVPRPSSPGPGCHLPDFLSDSRNNSSQRIRVAIRILRDCRPFTTLVPPWRKTLLEAINCPKSSRQKTPGTLISVRAHLGMGQIRSNIRCKINKKRQFYIQDRPLSASWYDYN